MFKTLYKIGDRICYQNNQEIRGNVLYVEMKPPQGWIYTIKLDDESILQVQETEIMLCGIIWREKFQQIP